MASEPFELIVRNSRWFDGTGDASYIRHIGVRHGRIAAVSATPLAEDSCPTVIDGTGCWIMPGFIDIHTHYDIEVLVSPGLGESVRHGVTTVVMGSCSLSAVHSEPIDCADMFSRVEALPREFVLSTLTDHKRWSSASEYVDVIEGLPLGPNVATMIGHSDLRAFVMGLGRSVDSTVAPAKAEARRMETLLEEALDAGMLGMSTMTSLFDKLDGDRFRSSNLPTTYAHWREYRRLNQILRDRGGLLQSAPNAAMPLNTLLFYSASAAFGIRPALRVTLIAAADAKSLRGLAAVLGRSARLTNLLFGAEIRWQHLPVPFEVYSDGIGLTAFEEFGAGAAALHIRDEIERNELLNDQDYRRQFRKDCARRFGPKLWNRNFREAEIVACPNPDVVGMTFGNVADRHGGHPADTFLDLVIAHGTALRWRTTIANHRPHVLNKLAGDPGVLLGFSDAGAHLRNAAFYNFPLRLLRRIHLAENAGQPFMSLEHAVYRLTGELARWYGLSAGTIRMGDIADFVVIDPSRLDDQADAYHEAPMAGFDGLSRMVNRNDEAVIATSIGGKIAFQNGQFTPGFGQNLRFGRFLRSHS